MQRNPGDLRVFVYILLSIVPALLLSGCLTLTKGAPDGPLHEVYRPIDDPASHAFIAESLEKAVAQFGEPAIPVNKVLLRQSKPTPEGRRYRIAEGFSLTQCIDSTNGVFVIYIGVDESHPNYYPLLGHECAHLVDPRILDWYMEGLATVFSRERCDETGRKWGDWEHHFEKTRRGPYGLSYRMMRELKEACPEEYPSILRYTAENGDEGGFLHIDIDAWMSTLPPARRQIAYEIIDGYKDGLLRNKSEQYYFAPPSRSGM